MRFRVQLASWHSEHIVEANSEAEARAEYMSRIGATSTDRRFVTFEELPSVGIESDSDSEDDDDPSEEE